MNRRQKNKKEGFFSKIFNGAMTIALTVAMLFGLQSYSRAANLKFALVSDTHYMQNSPNTTFKMIGESPRLLEDVINQINEEKDLDFTMFTGDLIDRPYEKELKSFLTYTDKLNTDWYFAFGNHDRCVGGYLTTPVYMEIVKNSNSNYNFNKSYYSFVPKKNYKVIVLDDIITNEITSSGYIDNEQLKWLKKELDTSKNNIVLIFMHIPIIEPFASPNHRLRNANTLKELIESYKNPIGVFQGHYHATKITQVNNVLYVNTPALVSYPNAFRIVNVEDLKDKVVFKFDWKETREKTIQKMAKILVFSGDLYEGEEKDRTQTYEIEKRK